MQATGAAPQVSIREADDEALAIMQHRMQNPGQLVGISWGPKGLDDKTGGLKPGETKSFRLPFDDLPASWNQAMPQLVIAGVKFS